MLLNITSYDLISHPLNENNRFFRMNTIETHNVEREINFLNYKFFEATKVLGKNNINGTDLHEYQVDFAYKINKLKYAPSYVISRIIANTHTFINEIPQH